MFFEELKETCQWEPHSKNASRSLLGALYKLLRVGLRSIDGVEESNITCLHYQFAFAIWKIIDHDVPVIRRCLVSKLNSEGHKRCCDWWKNFWSPTVRPLTFFDP